MRGLGGVLGDLMTRAVGGHTVRYDVTDTVTGDMQTFTLVDGLSPDWGSGDYRGGLSIPGAARATTIISDIIGALPWDAYRQIGNRPLELLRTPPLLEQPFPYEQRVDTFSSWATDYLWDGNAVGLWAARDAQGVPTSVLPVPAESVGVRWVTAGQPSPLELPAGEVEYNIGGRAYSRWEVLHIKGPHKPGALRGTGVLERHFDTLSHSLELGRQARAVSRHGVPTGVIELGPETLPEDAAAVKQAWLASQRDRTIAAIANGSFKPISWNPEELQLIDARKFSLVEWALIFGLPFSLMGAEAGSPLTYSNLEADGRNLLRTTMLGHLARFEQTLSAAFPRGTRVKANLDAILRSDTKTRYEAHQIALTAGFLTVDEVRDLEDLPPLPDQPDPEPPTDPTEPPADAEEDDQ
ncbi:phage portal protein [Actinoplanes sp. NPDC051861]|uniref:phage portal protein n=1 Tax=Actinoplanes sp. NPDC051861 TaxID=3155170 RepID=UPI003447919D